ncbi:hypothetical protein [Bradyrhizobium cajani]|uniref:Uncharacterized protein n=1 Tax=Bradyrhizobium cajani TaxID=1928661 RepID=A0A844TQV0_9BRAD|nr:hypothetical protein [Bradyrhizobium cajani]MCP3373812.1 hypothetical protein [Bradyrhizobium cajani]MVT78164.1 hypothetical protein [Bradyrhizobium cajani]
MLMIKTRDVGVFRSQSATVRTFSSFIRIERNNPAWPAQSHHQPELISDHHHSLEPLTVGTRGASGGLLLY